MKRWPILIVLMVLEGIALVLAYCAIMVSVASAAIPQVESFVRWLLALVT